MLEMGLCLILLPKIVSGRTYQRVVESINVYTTTDQKTTALGRPSVPPPLSCGGGGGIGV